MDIKMSKEELTELLGNIFDVMLSPENIGMETDPFALVIGGIPVEKLGNFAAPPALQAQVEDPAPDFVSIDDAISSAQGSTDVPAEEEEEIFTYDQLLARNQELREQKTPTPTPRGAGLLGQDMQPLGRPLGPNEFEEPPEVSEDELRGHMGGGRHHG